MGGIRFLKMHGLGNDFVVLDGRREPLGLDAAAARVLANRRTGIGCDQVIVIEPPRDPEAHAFMSIRNPDGSEAEACGNATRCVAMLLHRESGAERIVIDTVAGRLAAAALADGRFAVDMGPVRTGWREVPLAREMDTERVALALGPLAEPVCGNVGNPHATFFVADAEAIDLTTLGPVLETHELFPQRANIGVAAITGAAQIRLRVWERGAGLTRACGSGACAALVAASRRGLVGRRAEIVLDGGSLEVEWREDGHAVMTGPAAQVFEGAFAASLVGG